MQLASGQTNIKSFFFVDNPILCDAALPEITSAMEVNHTRVYGVSHCPPLSEQPVTSKPNAFLGYIPETTPDLPAAISANIQEQNMPENRVQQVNPFYVNPSYQPLPLSIQKVNFNEQRIENSNSETAGLIDNKFSLNNPEVYVQKHSLRSTNDEQPVENKSVLPEISRQTNVLQDETKRLVGVVKSTNPEAGNVQISNNKQSSEDNARSNTQTDEEREQNGNKPVDPQLQEKQINKMASEIEMLRTQIEELANQNVLLAKNINQIKSETTSNQSKEQDSTLKSSQ